MVILLIFEFSQYCIPKILADPNDPYSLTDQEQKPQFTNLRLIQEMSQMPLMQAVGSNLQLQCAAKGNPTPSIEWYKNGQKVKESWNQHGEDWALELKNLQSTDGGQYSCRVANIFGRINASFYLTVQESAEIPEWLGNPVNISIPEGQTATFQCKVRSSIPPTIQWLRRIDDPNQATAASPDAIISLMGRNYTVLGKSNERKPEQEPGTDFWQNKLVLQNVRKDHEGWYICVVHNLYHGQVTHKEAFLRIQPSSKLKLCTLKQATMMLQRA